MSNLQYPSRIGLTDPSRLQAVSAGTILFFTIRSVLREQDVAGFGGFIEMQLDATRVELTQHCLDAPLDRRMVRAVAGDKFVDHGAAPRTTVVCGGCAWSQSNTSPEVDHRAAIRLLQATSPAGLFQLPPRLERPAHGPLPKCGRMLRKPDDVRNRRPLRDGLHPVWLSCPIRW